MNQYTVYTYFSALHTVEFIEWSLANWWYATCGDSILDVPGNLIWGFFNLQCSTGEVLRFSWVVPPAPCSLTTVECEWRTGSQIKNQKLRKASQIVSFHYTGTILPCTSWHFWENVKFETSNIPALLFLLHFLGWQPSSSSDTPRSPQHWAAGWPQGARNAPAVTRCRRSRRTGGVRCWWPRKTQLLGQGTCLEHVWWSILYAQWFQKIQNVTYHIWIKHDLT